MPELEELCQEIILVTRGLNIYKLLDDLPTKSVQQRKFLCLWLFNEPMLRCACILREDRLETTQEWDEYINICNELVQENSSSLTRKSCSQLKNEIKSTKSSLKWNVLDLLICYFDYKAQASRHVNHDLKNLLCSRGFESKRLNRSDVIEFLKRNGYQL